MLNYNDAFIEKLVIHQVGNKNLDEGVMHSQHEVELEDNVVKDMLSRYFFIPFKNQTNFFRFSIDDEKSEILDSVAAIFSDPGNLLSESVSIADLLYEKSDHPRIKSGELYVVLIKDFVLDDEVCDAVGIFKSENKETFLKIYNQNNNFNLGYESGININKLDKGCLIFNTMQDDGFRAFVVDNLSNEQAAYWKLDFLQLKPVENEYFHTQNYIKLVNNFTKDVIQDELQADKKEQVAFMNKTAEFFTEKPAFSATVFEEEVLADRPEMIESFRRYKSDFEEENNFKIVDEFEISQDAVKGNKKYLKSVIKLDKNFHLYIHGKEDFVEKGYDNDRKMNYYKLYFQSES
jgi:hypothetical protein